MTLRSALLGKFLGAGLALVGLLTPWSPASAHAVLLSTDPADGARVERSPSEILLHFSEPVRPTLVQVLGSDGLPLEGLRSALLGADKLQISPPSSLPNDSYIVTYRVTSIDGHPVSGSFIFGVGTEAQGRTLDPTAARTDHLSFAAAINRAVHYCALLAAAGAAIFIVIVLGWSHPMRQQLRNGHLSLIAIAAGTLVLSVGINGAQLIGLSARKLATAAPWVVGADTSLMGSAVAGFGGLGLITVSFALRRSTLSQVALLVGALISLASLVLTGHAASAPPRALSATAVYLHVLAAAFWVGSLWPLWIVLRHAPAPDAAEVVRRFSGVAVGAVAVLLVAGLALSIVQLKGFAPITTTSYGWIWACKLALVVLLLALAALNRQVLTPRLAKGLRGGPAALRRSIVGELTMVAGIVGGTALLAQTPPPRALAMTTGHEHIAPHPGSGQHPAAHALHAGSGHTVEMHAGQKTAMLSIQPGDGSRRAVSVRLLDQGRPVKAQEVTSFWSLPSAGIEPLQRPLAVSDKGNFAGWVNLPIAGHWTVKLEVLITDFEKISFESDVQVIGVAND